MSKLSKKIKVMTMAGTSASLVIAGFWAPGLSAARSASTSDAGGARSGSPSHSNKLYTDGFYTATGKYGSLPSFITVTVTLVDDVITDVIVIPHATDPTSLDLQRRFAAAIPATVVGKPIDAVNVGRVAGSSGTPKGFNAAIQRIKERAAK